MSPAGAGRNLSPSRAFFCIAGAGRASFRALFLTVVLGGAAQASPPAQIVIPGKNLATESLTSTEDGAVIVGSMGTGAIFRAKPGAALAEKWIESGTDGLEQVLGVLADDRTRTLWACSSNTAAPAGRTPPPSTLHAFDLATGAPKGKWPLPTAGAVCNDIAIGPDGSAYATDTANMEIVRLPLRGKALEVWAGNGDFGRKGGVLDGIAVVKNTVIVNVLDTGKLFSVPIGGNGQAGKVQPVQLDRSLNYPDGQRSFGRDSILVVEAGGGGRLSRIQLSGPNLTRGEVTELKKGFPDNATAVTVVGGTAYVLQAQFDAAERSKDPKYPPKPFTATAVEIGKP